MKTVQSILTGCVLLGACATATAEGVNAQFGGSVGFTVPMGDFNDPSYGTTRISGYDPGVNLSAYLVGPIRDALRWRVEFGKDQATASSDLEDLCTFNGAGCGSAYIKRYTAGLQWDFATEGKIDPYLFVTAGGFNQERRVDQFLVGVFPFEISDSHTDFGMRFGGGARYALGRNWGASLDVSFTGIFEKNDRPSTWYFAPTGSIYLNF